MGRGGRGEERSGTAKRSEAKRREEQIIEKKSKSNQRREDKIITYKKIVENIR